jgi:hypothetical protein
LLRLLSMPWGANRHSLAVLIWTPVREQKNFLSKLLDRWYC